MLCVVIGQFENSNPHFCGGGGGGGGGEVGLWEWTWTSNR